MLMPFLSGSRANDSHQNPRSLETLSCVVRGRLNSKIQGNLLAIMQLSGEY